jgi:hypothetical protein
MQDISVYRIRSNKVFERTIAYFYCIHLRNLNIHHIGMVEAMRLKIMALRSPSVASPAYQIS